MPILLLNLLGLTVELVQSHGLYCYLVSEPKVVTLNPNVIVAGDTSCLEAQWDVRSNCTTSAICLGIKSSPVVLAEAATGVLNV